MKSYIYKIVAIAALLLICSASFAKNETRDAEKWATKRIEKMNQVCDLSAQQQADLKEAFINNFNARQSMKAQLKNSKGKLAAPANPQKGQLNKTVKTILTPEQLEKWQAHKQKK